MSFAKRKPTPNELAAVVKAWNGFEFDGVIFTDEERTSLLAVTALVMSGNSSLDPKLLEFGKRLVDEGILREDAPGYMPSAGTNDLVDTVDWEHDRGIESQRMKNSMPYNTCNNRRGGEEDAPYAPQPQPQPQPEPERKLRPVMDPPEPFPLSPDEDEWLRRLTEDL